MRLTDYFIKRKVRSLARRAPGREHRYCSLDKADKILLLYSLEDKEAVKTCLEKLRAMDKEVKGCLFVPAGKKYEEEATDIQVKEESDTGLLMFPKSHVTKQLQDTTADILIDLSRPSDHIMHYLMLSRPSLLKIGRKKRGAFPVRSVYRRYRENGCFFFIRLYPILFADHSFKII